MFSFDERLLNDCEVIGKFKLCHVLLMRDANYPWVLLVPDRENIIEIFDLSEEDQKQLQLESITLLKYLSTAFNADKMNVAALGNIVAQCHVHHVVRYKTDKAWPGPVWGAYPAQSYTDNALADIISKLCAGLDTLGLGFEAK